MNKKIIFIFFILILLTGCTSEYKLEISNGKFKENISATIPKNMVPQVQEEIDIDFEYDDPVTPFLEEKTASLTTNEDFYKKKIDEKNDYFKINLNYTYDEENFKIANSINTCFEYPELDFSKNYYINLQGAFYCLYGDSLDIKIKTKNKVVFNNADEVLGNTYIWHIDEKNVDYVDIKLDIKKGTPNNIIIGVIILVVAGIATGIIGYKFYTKNKKRNTI